MKKTIVFSVILIMILSLCSCAKTDQQKSIPTLQPTEKLNIELTTQPTPEATVESISDILADVEVQRAIANGLVPNDIQGNYDQTVTFAQYSQMLTNVISVWDESRLPEWQKTIAAASASDKEMYREDGILAMSYAMVLMGITSPDGYHMAGSQLSQEELDQQSSELSWDYPFFLDYETIVYPWIKSNYIWGGVRMTLNIKSNVTQQAIFPYDFTAHSMHLKDPLTRREAITSVLRLAETDPLILEPEGKFVSIYDAGTYDKSIITNDLLAKPSTLPEVTQSKTPDWKGAGIWRFKSLTDRTFDRYRDYQESSVQFLSENGMNFAQLNIDFSTLRFPYTNSDLTMVNQRELEEMDQLLAWCIKHDVHLQIYMGSMNDIGMLINGPKHIDSFSDKEWQLATDYWTMLAKRYAGIPSKNLSFSLLYESFPTVMHNAGFDPNAKYTADSFNVELSRLKKFVDAVRSADPDRVQYVFIPAYFTTTDWANEVASLGVSIQISNYAPHWVSTTFDTDMQYDPYIVEPNWPIPYFPMGKIASGETSLMISGEVSSGNLGIHIDHGNNQPEITVLADGNQVGLFKIEGTENPNDPRAFASGDKLYSAEIPAGTKEITVKVTHGFAWIDLLRFEGKNGIVTMRPQDATAQMDYSDPLPLVIKSDGTYTNSEDRFITGEAIYQQFILPYQKIAEKNNVGFMTCFEIHGAGVPWDFGMVGDYYNDILATLNKHGVAWSKGELERPSESSTLIALDGRCLYTGCTLKQSVYQYPDGRVESFWVNQEMLTIFRNYTLNQ